VRAADAVRSHHQPPAARRAHGLRPKPRQHFDRASPEGCRAAACGAVGIDAQHGRMVMLEVSAVPVLTDNYVWLIHNAEIGETAAVDPSVADPVLEPVAARGWAITQVLNTHWHPDHTGGNEAIKAATDCSITAPDEARRVSQVDRVVSEGDRVTVA